MEGTQVLRYNLRLDTVLHNRWYGRNPGTPI